MTDTKDWTKKEPYTGPPVVITKKTVITDTACLSHIFYHLILRRCSISDYIERKKQHTDLGAYFVASFFELSDSETPMEHFHCLIQLPACKKTYEDRFRRKYDERNLQVIKQIKPITLDPTHLENTLLYIAKDGHQVDNDGSIDWSLYSRKRIEPKTNKTKANFTELLVEAFSKEMLINPHLYVSQSKHKWNAYEPHSYERNLLTFISKFFTRKPKGFDETIILRNYHLLVSIHNLKDCVNIVDLCVNRLVR